MVIVEVFFIYTLVFLASVLHVHCRGCELEGPYSSRFVTSYYDVPSRVWGCSTKSTLDSGQEVYIVHVRKPKDNQVVLNISPRQKNGVHSAGLIIILVTPPGHVTWTVNAERIGNDSKHTLVVPRSVIVSHDALLSEVVTKWRLPGTNNTKRLIRWAKRHYDVVTSVLDAEEGNVVNLKVGGIDPSWPTKCEPSNIYHGGDALTRSSMMSYGCEMGNHDRNRVLHILHVTSAERSATGETKTVLVEVTPGPGRRIPKHLTLVLQTERPILWKVMAKDYQGTLKVVAKGQVEGDRDMKIQELESNKEQFKLIKEVKKKFFQPSSFLTASLTNHIKVALTTPDLPRGETGITTERAKTTITTERVKTTITAARVKTTITAERVKTTITAEKAKNQKVPRYFRPRPRLSQSEKQRSFLERGMHTSCLTTGMTVVIRKYQLRCESEWQLKQSRFKPTMVTKEELTLEDRTCIASENNTHFILNTTLNGCGTVTQRLSDGVAFINKVYIRYSTTSIAADSDDEASGSGPPTFSDDEDFSMEKTISVEFRCEYSTPGRAVPESNYKADIKMALLESMYKILDRPIGVFEGTRAYVSAALKNRHGAVIKSQLHNCWTSARSDIEGSNPGNRRYMMKNGCGTEDLPTKRYHGYSSHRFSFVADRKRSRSFMFVHCEMVPCENCLSQNDYCKSNYKKKINATMLVEPMTEGVTLGALVLNKDGVIPKQPEEEPGGNPFAGVTMFPKPPSKAVLNKSNGTVEAKGIDAAVKSNSEIVMVSGLGTGPVVGIAFASFIIGIALTAALWCIHSHTGQREMTQPTRLPQHTPTPESSANSTPNSTQPISVRT